jgi:hypothetical protein
MKYERPAVDVSNIDQDVPIQMHKGEKGNPLFPEQALLLVRSEAGQGNGIA